MKFLKEKSMQKKIKVFVEGEVLVLDHFSGIGHYTAALLQEVDKLLTKDEFSHISIEIGLPRRLSNRVERFNYQNFTYKKMPFSPKVYNQLKSKHLLPPIDLFYGKRIYVFTHFTTWPSLRSPLVPIIYDLSFIHYPQHSAEKNQKFLEAQTELSAKRAARIITISENSKKEISSHYNFPVNHIDTVIPVLDTNKFQRQPEHVVKNIRAKYSLFDDFILYVGNIEPRKNLVSLLKAYEGMNTDLQKKYSLLLVGAKGWKDGEIYEQITQMRDKGLNVIQPTSYVEDEDLPALYSAASAFAYVSVYEGYGIPPTEAMACGTAVICSDNSSLPEAVEDAAYKVNALDIKAITNGLEQVLSNESLRNKLIEKGFERVKRLIPKDSAYSFLKSIEETSKQGNSK